MVDKTKRRSGYISWAGDEFVAGCGVDLYATRYSFRADFQSLPSTNAALIVLPKLFMKLSTCPLVSGHEGVTRYALKPAVRAKSLNAFPLKGGPLSILTTSGTP